MRKRKLVLNTVTSLINQFVSIICGFILPKLFLEYYGSAVNGLVSSITQFLGFIAFLELGVGAVVQSSLYKPLANNDSDKISKIIKSSDRFFKKIAYILLIYTIVLAFVYPILTLKSFNYLYTFLLIIIISISSFSQYYFGIKYQLLLNADQKSYVQLSIQIITLVLNTIITMFLINMGISIHIVKLVTSILFILRPIFLMIYVKRNYFIDKNIELLEEPIKQKWNGLAQHLAAVVLGNTDIVILTIFSTLENVSVYSVYNLVVIGIRQVITALTTGVTALFGNMLAKKEINKLLKTFEKFEIFMNFCVVTLFTITSMLIIPFIEVYTKEIKDTNYIVPIFAMIMVIAQAVYCLRLPYNIIVLAAGHYKQTQKSAIIEMIINIIVSLLGVIKFGLIGVALGTFLAMIYRTIYLVMYLSKNIINRSSYYFIKHMILNILIIILSIVLCKDFNYNINTYIEWIKLAFKVSVNVFIIAGIANFIAYYKIIITNILKNNL